jgi:hypothetical protein
MTDLDEPAPEHAPSNAGAGQPDGTWSPGGVLNLVTKFGPPITVVTALMLYFGWARADAQSRAMGIDVSMFGYTTQDYVLRSLSTLYLPLLALGGVALGWLALHRRVTSLAETPAGRPTVHLGARVGLLAGVALAAATLLMGWRLPDTWPLAVPLTLAAAVAVAGYCTSLASRTAEPVPGRSQSGSAERVTRAVLIGGVVSLALFWELSSYATVVGRGYAQRITQTVSSLPRVTVTSPDPLGVQAPGVHEESVAVTGDGSAKSVRYRTTGLRLLVVSGGRIFLLNDGWRPGAGVLVVLPDDDSLHWQLSR